MDPEQSHNHGLSVAYICLATISIFLREHFQVFRNFYTADSKKIVGQSIRGLIFKKLQNADYNFLYNTDASFISKIIFFELEHVIKFIHILPDILSAPFWITFAIGVVYLEVGIYSLYAGIIILIVVTMIMLLNHLKLNSIKTFTSRSSKRSIVLSEMVPNMKMVKLNSMEGFLRGKLASLRKLELESVGQLNLIYSIMDFFYTLLP